MDTIYRFNGQLLRGGAFNRATKEAAIEKFGHGVAEEAIQRRAQGDTRPIPVIRDEIYTKDLGVEVVGALN